MSPRRCTAFLALLCLLALVACQARNPTASKDVPRLTVEQVKALQDAGEKVVIVDTRAYRRYQIRHIPGAISIPIQEIAERYGELPRDATIAFY